jgi:hypothetical protein
MDFDFDKHVYVFKDGADKVIFEFQPGIDQEKMSKPYVSNELAPIREFQILAAEAGVGATLWGSAPLSVEPSYKSDSAGVKALWGETDIDESEYLAKAIITEIAGYASERSDISTFEVDEALLANYSRASQLADRLLADPVRADLVIKWLEGLNAASWTEKLGGEIPPATLQEVVPPQLLEGQAFKALEMNERKAKIMTLAYTQAKRVLAHQADFIKNLATRGRAKGRLEQADFIEAAKESYKSASGYATKREIVENQPGTASLTSCKVILQRVSLVVRGKRFVSKETFNVVSYARGLWKGSVNLLRRSPAP